MDEPSESATRDAAIVARIRAGDRAAEIELYDKYAKSVTFMLRKRTRNTADAEDLAQVTFIKVLQTLRTKGIEDPGRLSGYVHRTAHFIYVDWVRKAMHQHEIEESDPDLLKRLHGTVSGPRMHLQEQQARSALDRLLLELLPRDREVLRRYYVLDREKARICAELNLTPANFDRVISRARQRFGELIEERQIDPDDLRALSDAQ